MKSKVRILTLVGLLTGTLTGMAQNNPPPGETPPAASPATPAAPSKDAAPAAETPAPAAVPADATPAPTPAVPAPAGDTPAATDATAASATTPVVVAANDAATATPPATNPAPAVTPVITPQPGVVIPLIVMDDVPLTDAIRNLARQAGLNYMLDPKIGFGQPDATGHVVPQPSVSIRWEGITAEQALNALLNNHSLQLVDDPKTKIFRITIKDPAAPPDLVTKILQLKYSSPSNIVAAVQSTLTDKRSKVVADVRTSQLVILGTEKEQVEVEELIAKLDTQTKQVLIEAKLIETSINPTTSKGIDWTGTLGAQHVTMGNNAVPGIAATPASSVVTASGVVTTPASAGTIGGILSNPGLIGSLSKGSFFSPSTAFLNADGVSAVLSFLNTYSDSKVISSPRTVTLDNETAHISVYRASPIINVTPGTANTTGGSAITYTNLGISLDVTPRISANNFVNLKVLPQVSRVADTIKRQVGTSGTYEVDEYDSRAIDTKVMIPSGNTLLLGGLVQDDVRKGNVKVPVLGDIPYLGLLFRSDTKARQKSELLVFITPTIVTDEDYQPTKSTYLKTPVPTSDDIEGDWSAWDSGKPKDWKHSGTKD